MARVTPYNLCLDFTQDSGRVPITWNPRETPFKTGESDALYFRADFMLSLGICFVFADVIRLCFCRLAFAFAFASNKEAARGRVRGESDSKHFQTTLAFEPLSENWLQLFLP